MNYCDQIFHSLSNKYPNTLQSTLKKSKSNNAVTLMDTLLPLTVILHYHTVEPQIHYYRIEI